MSKPVRTFIYGSCVSRDTIAAARKGEYEIVGYVARQSLISMARNAIDAWPSDFRLGSEFKQRMVEGDWIGNAWKRLVENKGDLDLILMDLTDERFGVFRRDNQSVVTRSIDMMGTDLEEVASEFDLLPFGSEENLRLFNWAAQGLAKQLKTHNLFEKTRILRIPWALATEDLRPTPASLGLGAADANKIYIHYYSILEDLGFNFIDVPTDIVYAYTSHQWGVAPFHYTPIVYKTILDKLQISPTKKIIENPSSTENDDSTATIKDYSSVSALHTHWGSADEFLQSDKHVNGVHTIQLGSTTVEFYLQGHPLQSEQTKIPLFFTGAVNDRSNKQPPFFSGYGVSKSIGTPFIAISDPIIDNNKEVNIAWYAGTLNGSLQKNLIELFKGIHKKFKKELIMVGGSAGGFASLYYAMGVGNGTSAFVWNPQTDITKYYEIFSKRYLGVAGIDKTVLSEDDWECQVKNIAEGALDLCLPAPKHALSVGKLILLQNRTDWHHIEEHLLPWLENSGWSHHQDGEMKLYVADENHLVAIADYEEGHNPIPVAIVETVLSSMLFTNLSARKIVE